MTQLPAILSSSSPASVPPSVQERIAFWLKAARPTTSRSYAGDLARFARWLGVKGLGEALAHMLGLSRSVALHTLERYQADLKSAGRSPATVNRAIAAVNSALREASKADVGPGAVPVKTLKARAYRDTRGPGVAKVTRLLDALADDSRPAAMRDRALFLLMAQRGLRRAEVAGLALADVDLAAARVRVRRKGADEADLLEISGSTAKALAAWIAVRGEVAAADSPALFVVLTNRKRGAPMTGDAIYRIVRARAQRFGWHIRPHGLRHGAITTLIERSNGNVAMAQAFAGHASPSTTTRYIDNLNDLAGQGVRLLADTF